MTKPIALVVDDHLANTKLLGFLLERRGMAVRTAATAAAAWAEIEREKPSIVLMDVQLPDVDGLTLTSRLRREPRYSDLVIVAVTAFAMPGDEEKALGAGCNAFVTKPIDTQAVGDLVVRLVAPAASGDQERR